MSTLKASTAPVVLRMLVPERSGNGKGTRVFLNDTDITDYCRSVEVKAEVGALNTSRIEMIGIPVEVETMLERGNLNYENRALPARKAQRRAITFKNENL